ncbi:MAG TPA: glutamate ABC transporter substrate-binding protein [Streptosporangiaceae bacterium]
MNRRRQLRLAAAILAVAGIALGTTAADAAPPSSHLPRARHASLAPSAPACDPKASSIRPSGPPQLTPGSYLATIKARGYLIAGVDQNTYHFGFLNPLDGNTEGFDIDMIDAVAKAIFGRADQSTVHLKAISDDQRILAVTSGSVDIVAHTMTINCVRLQQVDFSSVYFDAAQRVLVQKDSAVRSLADLKGQKVCATNGSTSLDKIKSSGAIGVGVQYWTDCLVLLQQGDVAAISTDDSILAGLEAQDPFTRLVGNGLTDEPYGLAIAKQHPEFVQFVNAVLEQLRTDGQWADSYRRWISPSAPAPPLAQYGS